MSSSIPDKVPDNATPEQLRHYLNYWMIEAKDFGTKYWNAMHELDMAKKRIKFLQEADRLQVYDQETKEWRTVFSIPTNGKPTQQ